MMLSLQQDFTREGVDVSMSQLCRWFEVPRRTVYYKATKAAPKVQEQLVQPLT
jgi:putative transposase